MWRCALCLDAIVSDKVVDHFRLMHPNVHLDAEPETWPDGEPVVYDDPDTEDWA